MWLFGISVVTSPDSWKFNNSLLIDQDCVEVISEEIPIS